MDAMTVPAVLHVRLSEPPSTVLANPGGRLDAVGDGDSEDAGERESEAVAAGVEADDGDADADADGVGVRKAHVYAPNK